MRIGIDARLWNETGVGRYIRNLVTNLATIDQHNEYILFLKRKEYETIVTPGNNFRKYLVDIHWHSLEEQTSFLKVLYSQNLDLVHFPYFSFPLLYTRPFVITIHDLILFHYPTGKASKLPTPIYNMKLVAYKRLMHHAAVHAKKIIAVSNATKQEIVTMLHADPRKIAVTYEGFIEKSQVSKLKSQIPIKNPYFLYVGNAYPHKNVEKLLKAFAEFNHEIKQVDLVLVGKQDYFYAEIKRKLLTFGIESSVHILEKISDNELINLYTHAIALVMPSLMEGFGLPAIEAMVNNCLVLASNISSLKEVCGDAAVYFDPLDREDMLRCLKKAYLEQESFNYNKMVGLERVKMFSWRKMAEETLQIYESIPPTVSSRILAKQFFAK